MTGSTFADHIAHQHHQSGVTLDVHSISKAVNNPDNKQGATILVRTWNHPVASCAGCMLPFRPWWKGRVQPWQTRGKCTWCCCWCLLLRIGRIVTSEYASCFDVFVGMLIASWQHPTMHQKSSEYGMDVDSYSPGGTIAATCWDLSGREHPLAHHASKKPIRSQTRDPSTPFSRKS